MKRLFKGISAMFLSATMVVSLMGTGAFAAQQQTLQVKESGTSGIAISAASITETANDFGIYETYDGSHRMVFSDELQAQITATGPVTVSNMDDCTYFSAVKMTDDETTYDGKQYSLTMYDWIQTPFSSGKVSASSPDYPDGVVVDATDPRLYSPTTDLFAEKFLANCTITLSDPGYYLISYDNNSEDFKCVNVFIEVKGSSTSTTTSSATATPTASKVTVNGTAVSFDAYNINGNNYFKLRDLAKAVNGTGKQFNILWDGTKNAINLVSNTAYEAVGGELAAGDGKTKTCTLSTSAIYKDGATVALTAYNINGNNYFKLRDIASAFNIGVTFDSATSTVGIDTSTGYTA